MKDYREMADSVFNKMELFEKKRRERRKVYIRTAGTLSAFLMIIGIYFIFKANSLPMNVKEPLNENATDIKCMDYKMEVGKEEVGKRATKENHIETFTMRSESLSGDKPKEEKFSKRIKIASKEEDLSALPEKIITNEGGDWIHKCNIPSISVTLKKEDMVSMNKDALNSYFGRNIFPLVPEDVKEWEVSDYQIYRENRGEGEVYYDRQVLNYSSDDFKRTVNLEAETLEIEGTCGVPPKDRVFETSLINGKEVEFFDHGEGIFSANFKLERVYFRLVTSGLSKEEAISVISSLTK